ncbi:MAG: hypothetical protein ACRELY_16335 [Polyangiaceae bacterium]
MPALVVSTTPDVLVAAYTDELDAIVLLRFDAIWAQLLHLVANLRLLTINTYGRTSFVSPDLKEGPRSLQRWTNVFPIIAETLSDDLLLIQQRKATLDSGLWQRAQELLLEMRRADRVSVRDGSPLRSRGPGTLSTLPKE